MEILFISVDFGDFLLPYLQNNSACPSGIQPPRRDVARSQPVSVVRDVYGITPAVQVSSVFHSIAIP